MLAGIQGMMVNQLPVRTMTVDFFCQAEDGIRDLTVTGETCALPISSGRRCHDSRETPKGRNRPPGEPGRVSLPRGAESPAKSSPQGPDARVEWRRSGGTSGYRGRP